MKNTLRTLLFAGFIISSAFIGCMGGSWPMGRGHMYGYGMYGRGGGIFMGILWIIILILIGFGIYYFVKTKGNAASSNETPLEILKKRYAMGEITKEEYESMKEDLK